MTTINNLQPIGPHAIQGTPEALQNYNQRPTYWDPILQQVELACLSKGYNPNDFYYSPYNRSNDGNILTIGHKRQEKVFHSNSGAKNVSRSLQHSWRSSLGTNNIRKWGKSKFLDLFVTPRVPLSPAQDAVLESLEQQILRAKANVLELENFYEKMYELFASSDKS